MEDMQKQVAELLENAMKQPGVAEMMQLCESQKTAIESYSQASQAAAPRWIVTSTSSTTQGVH